MSISLHDLRGGFLLDRADRCGRLVVGVRWAGVGVLASFVLRDNDVISTCTCLMRPGDPCPTPRPPTTSKIPLPMHLYTQWRQRQQLVLQTLSIFKRLPVRALAAVSPKE